MAKTVSGSVSVAMDKLGETMGNLLDGYSNIIMDLVNDAVIDVGKETAKVAKDEGHYTDRRPKYRKSIKEKHKRKDRFDTSSLIHASGHEYSLTHLLEKGHKVWNKPSRGNTRAFPHWEVAEEYAAEELPKAIMKRIESI